MRCEDYRGAWALILAEFFMFHPDLFFLFIVLFIFITNF
ncbi:hypothetical protein JCM19237_796 [Photobacterium aphoticum]|uniref:Uncharacterized protein n=1 Tax=Photobacterium aphoticum TaxID=754436 RepID=A0A090R227_9GAMM|nr:hypothetical protein JCM19237_796 [Photobacterium aphoticum]